MRAVIFVLVLSAAAGCEKSSSTSPTPEPQVATLAGAWTGRLEDSSGLAQTDWQLIQTGTAFSGTVALTDTDTGYRARGSVSGTIDGTAAAFALRIAAGGFNAPFSNCTADVTGRAQVTATTLAGDFSGTNSCTGPISSGRITLTRQP